MKFQNWYGYDETAFPFSARQRNFEEAAKRIRARINARIKQQQEGEKIEQREKEKEGNDKH